MYKIVDKFINNSRIAKIEKLAELFFSLYIETYNRKYAVTFT